MLDAWFPPAPGVVEAVREAMVQEMRRDAAVFLMGEDIGVYGGAFKATAGLLERFGAGRVVDTPVVEEAIVGAAIGNWAFRVPLAGLAASNHMPLVWLWTALVFDHIARMALLAFEFRRGGWKRRAMKKAAIAAG